MSSAKQDAESSPTKAPDANESLKRKGSDVTPEKGVLPPSQKRVVSPTAPAVQQGTAVIAGSGEDKFRSFAKVSWMQYNNLYTVRLAKLRGAALTQAQSLWSSEVPASNFLSSIDDKSKAAPGDLVIIGIVFKDMPKRSNVIEQYRDCQVATSCLPEEDIDKQENLCSEADEAWLEDATFRIKLNLDAERVAKLATGLVAAIRGTVTAKGTFDVKQICFTQGLASSPLPSPARTTAGPYLALLSGLNIGAPDEDVDARDRAVNFLLGKSGQSRCNSVERVMVCGGVYWVKELKDVPPGLDAADKVFAQLAEKLPVDVLPGHKDPSNLSLPQMPLHPYFFPTAQKNSQFKSVSNPYECTLGGLQILGSAGQPVRDMLRCTSISTPMEALTTCLDASLLAPTAPDTLITQPFDKADPFIIEKMPQVLFSAGHSKAEVEWRAAAPGSPGTLCVCVPAFHKHPAVVLVNLQDPRDVHIEEFGTQKS